MPASAVPTDAAPTGAGDGAAADKVSVIHNFVDLERIRPMDRHNDYRRRHGLGDRTVVMYAGNVGLSQPFELIRAAAERWAGRPEVVFVINGEGAARPAVDAWARDLDNVVVADFGDRAEVPSILGAADLHLILLRSGLARSSTPSKLYSILAAGRPVLASIDEGSEVSAVVKEHDLGRAVPPDDPWALCQALDDLLAAPEARRAMEHRARRFAEEWLTPQAQAAAYDALFRRLRRPAPGPDRW